MSRRTQKVSSLLQHEIGNFILRLELPAMTTISKVEVTPDLKWTKVWVTIMGDKQAQKETLQALNESRRDLNVRLMDIMTMKFVPRVRFIIDAAEEYAAHINELLKEAHE